MDILLNIIERIKYPIIQGRILKIIILINNKVVQIKTKAYSIVQDGVEGNEIHSYDP